MRRRTLRVVCVVYHFTESLLRQHQFNLVSSRRLEINNSRKSAVIYLANRVTRQTNRFTVKILQTVNLITSISIKFDCRKMSLKRFNHCQWFYEHTTCAISRFAQTTKVLPQYVVTDLVWIVSAAAYLW